MQQHQQKVNICLYTKRLACLHINHFFCVSQRLVYIFFSVYQTRQQAAAGGQPQPNFSNGPSAESSPHPGHPHTSPVSHTSCRPPCVLHPTTNGPCSSNPSEGLPGHLDLKNHSPVLGGGSASNGNVPYLQQNTLPHTCTGASHPSTSSTTSSPSPADDTGRSQQRNTTTQVFHLCHTFPLQLFIKISFYFEKFWLFTQFCNNIYILLSAQGLQKGPGSHLAGPNGEPPFSSSTSLQTSSFGILNQGEHCSGPCTASSSASSLSPTSPQTTPNHLSSPPHSITTSGVHTKDITPSRGKNGCSAAATLSSGPETTARQSGGASNSPSTTPAQGLTNHVQPRVMDSSSIMSQPGSPAPGMLSSDNPQLSAFLKGKDNASSNDDSEDHSNHKGSSSEKINSVHPALHSSNTKQLSEHSVMSTPTPSLSSAEPLTTNSFSCLNTLSNSQAPTLNGKEQEDSQSLLKVEPSGSAHRHSVPAAPPPWSSVSIYPSSNDVLKACR